MQLFQNNEHHSFCTFRKGGMDGEASRVPFLHTRRGLTLLFELCSETAIRVRSGPGEVRRGNMSFLPPLEMRPSSIAPNPVESRETPPNYTVSLTSQWHP